MNVFKIAVKGKKSACWYGKVRRGGNRWSSKIRLFTDKKASEKRLRDLQADADRRAAGMQTAETDRLALPLDLLVDQYIESLKARKMNAEHVRITEWSLDKWLEVSKWKVFADISAPAAESLLPLLGTTAAYQNCFIKKLKAFVHWLLPEGWIDPLKKLKRVREKGARKTRERRAATLEELDRFFKIWRKIPPDRQLCYALALLNSLRRGEIANSKAGWHLRWGQLHLDAPIPFIELKQKMGEGVDYIPLHPHVMKLLKERMPGLPDTPVVQAVPDVKTLEKDLKLGGIEIADAQGRRLDFHALRHTFQTLLDRTGCSRATKKKLMRHANEDVTDGYAHAELAEMLTALMRLPSPTTLVVPQVKTGTHVTAERSAAAVDHRVDQTKTTMGRSVAQSAELLMRRYSGCRAPGNRYNPSSGEDLRDVALAGNGGAGNLACDAKNRPSTQVD